MQSSVDNRKMEEVSEHRRAPKRPHSPQKSDPQSSEKNPPPAQTADVMQSDEKRDKLLRLLGGKKRKNETAASKWLERVRSREDELKVSTELESQFNESLTNRLTGASRRHLGIGFKDDTNATAAPDANTALKDGSSPQQPEPINPAYRPSLHPGAPNPISSFDKLPTNCHPAQYHPRHYQPQPPHNSTYGPPRPPPQLSHTMKPSAANDKPMPSRNAFYAQFKKSS